MDQLRVIVKLMWRERFWVLCVVGTLVAVVCWHISSGDLDQEFNSRKTVIKSAFDKMNSLKSEPVHPNEDVNQGDQAQFVSQREIVRKVWEDLYDRQREEVLYWPEESLKEDFITEIKKLQFGDPFPVHASEEMRRHYQNYIETRFDGLLKIAKALKIEGRGDSSRNRGGRSGGEFEGGGGYSAAGALADGEQQQQDYLIEWEDQNELREKLDFKTKPTPMQIWVTQEDLWVYETLLNVIANTNQERGATRPDNTAVRVIDALQVGRDAAAASRETALILMPGGEGGAGGEGGRGMGGEGGYEGRGMGGEGGYDERGMGGGEEGGFSQGAEMADSAVLANRYLDAEGLPYEGELRDSEFRRLPVRMRLIMDQRWIPQILIECANAALPVEVKQLRLNPDQSGGGLGSSSGRSSRGGARGQRGLESMKDDANLADVEIRGIVYIYNKPNETVLGLDEDQLADVTANEQR